MSPYSPLAWRPRPRSPAELPLVMLQHFRGNMDNWDRALTDALAAEREVMSCSPRARAFN
jgi:hypothetical protein